MTGQRIGKRTPSLDLSDLVGPRRVLRTIAGHDDFYRRARRTLPRGVFDAVDGAAGAELTARANLRAFASRILEQRTLAGVSDPAIGTTVFGQRLSVPVMLSPAGGSGMVHPEAERGAASAAGASGTIFCVPMASTRRLEEVLAASSGPLWLQVFPWTDRRALRAAVDRARSLEFSALVVTVDCGMSGNHERDTRNGATLPPRPTLRGVFETCRHPRWARELLKGDMLHFPELESLPWSTPQAETWSTPGATWSIVGEIRRMWDGPLVAKGILSVRDADLALEQGVDGIYVSNHGGRQLDGTPASLDALPAIAERVGDRAEVFLDGGVRRAVDLIKARALGARACFVGRPWFFALAVAGGLGVEHLLSTISEDLERNLVQLGVPSFDAVTSSVIRGREPSDATS